MKLYQNLINLKDYTPKHRSFTSGEEIKYIRETLHFSEATDDDLYNYRTLVVMMWRELRKGADESKEMDYWQAMMSLTAVIDREMYEVRGLNLN